MGPSILSNPFAESFMFSPLILHSIREPASWTPPHDPGRHRLEQSDRLHDTDVLAGFARVFTISSRAAERIGPATGGDNIGVSGVLHARPADTDRYYERDQISNPVNSARSRPPRGVNVLKTKKVWMVVARTTRSGQAYGSYGRSKWDVLNYESKTASAGALVLWVSP